MSTADIQALASALDVFTGVPDKAALERANQWLQEFQHSVILSRLCKWQCLIHHPSDPFLAGGLGDLQRHSPLTGVPNGHETVCGTDFPMEGTFPIRHSDSTLRWFIGDL
jgi:hypothetical protein